MPLSSFFHMLTPVPQHGSRALREAVSLAPNNPHVKSALDRVQSDDLQHHLQTLCSKFVTEHDQAAGREALSYLNRSAEVPGDIAKTCLNLVARPGIVQEEEIQDGIVAGILRESLAAKAALAKKLHENTTTVAFEDIFNLGDRSSDGMTDVMLDAAVWPTESERQE